MAGHAQVRRPSYRQLVEPCRFHIFMFRISRIQRAAALPPGRFLAQRAQLVTILQLGDQRLRKPSLPCSFGEHLLSVEAQLHQALQQFRDENGYGRGISAPQIGYAVRMIALNLGSKASHRRDGPFTMVNPEILWRSDSLFSMWDDCMSHPDLMVRLQRHTSISLSYCDVWGRRYHWEELPTAEAELVQHEMDHLDGVLAVDRAAFKPSDVISRADYLERREQFDMMVDYKILGTIE